MTIGHIKDYNSVRELGGLFVQVKLRKKNMQAKRVKGGYMKI